MSFVAAVLLISLMLASCAPAATPVAPVATTVPEVTEPTVVSLPTEVPPAATEVVEPAVVSTPTKEYPPAPEYIEIGASIPLTGKFGSLGSQVKVGYNYAIDAINADGGVYVEEYGKKIPLRLTSYDDESDPTKAVSNLENVFSEQNVVAYLGGAASGMHAATTAIAEKN